MKRFSLLPFVLVLCFGCKPESAKEDLRQFLQEHEPTTQIFKVSTDSLIELYGKKGTVLKIDPQVLQHQDGSAVQGAVEIQLLELTSKEDLLLANTQTISDGKWLISGGAYNIQIFSENKELKIADGEKIDVNFPKIASAEMQLSNGKFDTEENINWVRSDKVLQNREYPVIIQKDTLFVLYNRAFAITMPVDTTINKVLDGRYTINDFIREYKQVDSIFIKSDTIHARIFNTLSRRDSVLISDDSSYDIVRSRFNAVVKEVYSSISVSRLGWINVDRFYPEIQDRVKYKLIPDHEMDGEEFFAIDIENNTVLNLYGYKTIVLDAPLNKRFYIVAFAIKDENIYGFKEEILIEENGELEVKYKKITKGEIKDYLKLN